MVRLLEEEGEARGRGWELAKYSWALQPPRGTQRAGRRDL